MLKLATGFSVFFATLLTAATVMAQDIPLPGPGGPDDRPPMPPPPTAQRPPVVTPPTDSGSLEPFPNQPRPPEQIGNAPVPGSRVYVMGAANVPRRGARDFVFYPSDGYNLMEVVGIVSTSGLIRVNSMRMTFNDGRPPVYANSQINSTFRPNEGKMWVYMANNVASIVVNVSDAGGNEPASFRVDAKAMRPRY